MSLIFSTCDTFFIWTHFVNCKTFFKCDLNFQFIQFLSLTYSSNSDTYIFLSATLFLTVTHLFKRGPFSDCDPLFPLRHIFCVTHFYNCDTFSKCYTFLSVTHFLRVKHFSVWLIFLTVTFFLNPTHFSNWSILPIVTHF